MAKTMTASQTGMTDGQIENVVGKLRDALRKHREEITSDAAQQALGVDNIGTMMFQPFREQAEMVAEMIVRRVKVNRTRTPQEAIDATGRTQYVDKDVVNSMPRGEGEDKDVYFFPLRKNHTVAEFQRALDAHGLKADPYALAAVNEQDRDFARSHPNGTQWVGSDGKHCYLTFGEWDGERLVDCRRGEDGWLGLWWVGGVRASS